MIDRNELKKGLEMEFTGFIPELTDIKKLDNKIECSKPVLKDLNIMISHSDGIHKALLEWHLENVERTMTRAEILREILVEKYRKFN